jgi:hypothetical protein
MSAKHIKNLDWTGDARLYRVDPPAKYHVEGDHDTVLETEFIIVSAVNAMFSGPETYIFPANRDGTAINMLEIDGSFKGDLDHEQALRNAGQDVT